MSEVQIDVLHALSLVVPHLSLAALVSVPLAAARDLGGASGT